MDMRDVLREYRNLAPSYDRRWSFYIAATLRETLRRLELRPGEDLLDVGCGTGVFLKTLSASVPGAHVSGVDPSPEMLAVARERLGEAVPLKLSHAESLPFPEEAFDVVVSMSAFHCFRNPLGALREMARVLRPSGQVVITDWCDDYLACRACNAWLRVFHRTHVQAYGRTRCRHLLQQAGFSMLRVDRYKINWLWGLMTAVGEKRAS